MAKKYFLGEASARKLRALIGGSMAHSNRPAVADGTVDDSEFLPPFAVQFAASVGSSPGSWIVWLPSTSDILLLGATPVNPTTGMSAATGYPSGWYIVPNVPAAGGNIYLVIDTSTSTPTASVKGQRDDRAGRQNIVLATVTYNSQSGVRSVKQFVKSALITGGNVTITGTDGTSESGSVITFASEENSNVGVTVTRDEQTGVVTATVRVRYV